MLISGELRGLGLGFGVILECGRGWKGGRNDPTAIESLPPRQEPHPGPTGAAPKPGKHPRVFQGLGSGTTDVSHMGRQTDTLSLQPNWEHATKTYSASVVPLVRTSSIMRVVMSSSLDWSENFPHPL